MEAQIPMLTLQMETFWDYRRFTRYFQDGMVSYNIDNLDLNSSYYYRWMACNSVNSEVWSVASEEGMLASGPLMKVLIHFRWTG